MAEAERYATVDVIASVSEQGADAILSPRTWRTETDWAYRHFVANETVDGRCFPSMPPASGAPLVADMSSCLFTSPLSVSDFGVIYAGAQKNFGPAGVTLVIVRDDCLGQVLPMTPRMFDYAEHADAGSMLNTPPVFAWYVLGVMMDWMIEQGGVGALSDAVREKSARLYAYIDGSALYDCTVPASIRSPNVVFRLRDSALEADFLAGAKALGLVGLKGHRAVGGIRASLYHGVPVEAVDALIDWMDTFAVRQGEVG